MARQLSKKSPVKNVKINKAKKPVVHQGVKGPFTYAVGRRKVATARIRLYSGRGESMVNGIPMMEYFKTIPLVKGVLDRPFIVTDSVGKFFITVKTTGSGIHAQLGAVIHGVSRALTKLDPSFKTPLKKEGFLTRDSRMKESRKIGMGGKARRTKQSPKR